MRMIRRQVPIILTFLVGVLYLSDWFVKLKPLADTVSTLGTLVASTASFMMGFAAVNIYALNYGRIRRALKDKNRFNLFLASWIILLLSVISITGIIFGRTSNEFLWWYTYFDLPCGATAYAATLFYLISATYRVMKVRSRETLILTITGVFGLLMNVPLVTVYWDGFYAVGSWLMNVLVTASYSSVTIGIGVGAILMGIRTLLAMETGYLGAEAED